MKTLNIKKTTKIVAMMILVILIVMSISNIAFADTLDPTQLPSKTASTTGIQSIGGQIINIVSIIGTVISIVILVVLGLKYMMGSAEEKAEYKKTLMPYVIGAALVFSASAIAGVVYNFANTITAT